MAVSSAQSLITIFGIGIGSVAIGGLLLRDGMRSLNEVLEKADGPSVPGRIVSSRQAARDLPAEDGSYSRTWQVEVVYEYEVRRRAYRRTQTKVFSSYLTASRYAARHENGAKARVFVDPREPDQGTLDPRLTTWRPWLYIFAGAGCVVIGLAALTRLTAG